jgi:uncharacterized protein (DUF2147 family)
MKILTLLIFIIIFNYGKAQSNYDYLNFFSNKTMYYCEFKNNFFSKNNVLYFLLKNSLKEKQAVKDYFIGTWSNQNQIVEIYKMDDSYYGKLLFNSETNQNMIKVILIQMKKRHNTLYGGTYYDISIGKEYEAKIKLKDTNTLGFTGFYGIFNKKDYWKRIQ